MMDASNMTTPTQVQGGRFDTQGLEAMARDGSVSNAAKTAEVSRQFESILVRQIVSTAFEPLFEGAEDEFRAQFTLRAPASDVPWPDPTPGNTPAAIVPLRPPPETAPPAGCWTPLLDRFGNLTYAVVRRQTDGFLIVGPGAAERVDLADVKRLVAEAARPPWPDAPEFEATRPKANYDLAWYAMDGDAFRYAGGSRGEAFTPASLDGGFVHDLVGRLRYLS